MTDIIVDTQTLVAEIFVTEEEAIIIETPATQGATGPIGLTGDPGSVWYTDAGAPAPGLGIDGDYYLNNVNGDVYYKSTGTWSLEINIKGVVDVTSADNIRDNSVVRGADGLKSVQESNVDINDNGDIYPVVDDQQTLGNDTKRWKDLYIVDANDVQITFRDLDTDVAYI